MTPSLDTAYVTWDEFRVYLSGIGTALVAVFGMSLKSLTIRSMLLAHFEKDDIRFTAIDQKMHDRFMALDVRLELEHSENKAAIQTLRADTLRSNELLFEELRSIRRLFDEFLLKQLPPR